MGAFKGLERSDVYLTDYIAHKQWEVSGSQVGTLGISLISACSGSLPYYYTEGDDEPFKPASGSSEGVYSTASFNKRLSYESVKALYYSGSLGDGTVSGSVDLSLQTTLTISGSRILPSRSYRDPRDTDIPYDSEKNYDVPGVLIISLPKDIVGTAIKPGSFDVKLDEDSQNYVEDGYALEAGIDTGCSGGDHIETDGYFEDLRLGGISDFEGVLIVDDSFMGTWSLKEGFDYPSPDHATGSVIGDVIYGQGQIIFTDVYFKYLLDRWDAEGYKWQSSQPMFTQHVNCVIQDWEFNRSSNPTMPEGETGTTPYITTVGLYTNAGELVAVAKISKPIKKAPDVDTTIQVKIDLG